LRLVEGENYSIEREIRSPPRLLFLRMVFGEADVELTSMLVLGIIPLGMESFRMCLHHVTQALVTELPRIEVRVFTAKITGHCRPFTPDVLIG